ncbi:MAG: HAMP domain-containing histidine kinase [Treponema sp.]|nr:HAMP domain-containing histidine kinase [Treponema sp.]
MKKLVTNPRSLVSRNVFKIWLAFAGLSIIIFLVLWFSQTVFLEHAYNNLQIRQIKKSAERVQNSMKIENTLLSEVLEHHLLALIFDEDLNLLFSADEHTAYYEVSKKWLEYYQNSEESDDSTISVASEDSEYDALIHRKNELKGRNYNELYYYLAKSLIESDQDSIEKITPDNEYVYGLKLKIPEVESKESKKVPILILVISGNLGILSGTVTILRYQLIIVIVITLVLALIVAMILGKRLSDEKLQKTRVELLANITHDLRTPLTLIRGYAESIKDITGDIQEARERDTDIIIRETERLSHLVGDILLYSSVHEKSEIQKEKFDFGEMTMQVLNQYGLEAFDAMIDDDCIVNGDKKQLERVVYNFVDNATRHSPQGNLVCVEVHHKGDKVRFSVQNFGKPIPEDLLSTIWDRYFSARDQRMTGEKTGLGLAITKGILVNHKAKFGVSSDEENGTIFWAEI